MEYTIDAQEKEAISILTRAKLLGKILTVKIASSTPVAGVAPIRVDVVDAEVDDSVQADELMALAAFNDIDLTTPSSDVSLATPTEGAILLGSGSGLIVLRTSMSGGFACSATCSTPGATRYFAAAVTSGSGILDCRMIRTVVYP